MSEIKTRAEAKEASVKKWADILTRIGRLQNDIDRMCGFCELAQNKASAQKVKEWRCFHCEPDAKKLCEEYITGPERSLGILVNSLEDAYQKTDNLLKQIRSLPVDLK